MGVYDGAVNNEQEIKMTYHATYQKAVDSSPFEITSRCFCCNEPIEGAVVSYDGFVGSDKLTRVVMHRDCAFALAQRVICDAWPHRNDFELMQNKR